MHSSEKEQELSLPFMHLRDLVSVYLSMTLSLSLTLPTPMSTFPTNSTIPHFHLNFSYMFSRLPHLQQIAHSQGMCCINCSHGPRPISEVTLHYSFPRKFFFGLEVCWSFSWRPYLAHACTIIDQTAVSSPDLTSPCAVGNWQIST